MYLKEVIEELFKRYPKYFTNSGTNELKHSTKNEEQFKYNHLKCDLRVNVRNLKYGTPYDLFDALMLDKIDTKKHILNK